MGLVILVWFGFFFSILKAFYFTVHMITCLTLNSTERSIMSDSRDVHMQFIAFPSSWTSGKTWYFKIREHETNKHACIFIARAFHYIFLLREKEERCLLYFFFPDTGTFCFLHINQKERPQMS